MQRDDRRRRRARSAPSTRRRCAKSRQGTTSSASRPTRTSRRPSCQRADRRRDRQGASSSCEETAADGRADPMASTRPAAAGRAASQADRGHQAAPDAQREPSTASCMELAAAIFQAGMGAEAVRELLEGHQPGRAGATLRAETRSIVRASAARRRPSACAWSRRSASRATVPSG